MLACLAQKGDTYEEISDRDDIIVITDDGYFVKQILFSSDVETVQGI
jgi:hypothetical protein